MLFQDVTFFTLYIYIYIYIYHYYYYYYNYCLYTKKKARSGRYPAQFFTDTDYEDDIELLANTQTQAESQLHSVEQTAGDIDLHVNADKAEYISFN